MEWAGWLALVLLLCYSAYPGKVKKLQSRVKKLERKQNGGENMSKIISGLVGKSCKLKTEDALALVGSAEMNCTVLDADDEWLKISYTDKKNLPKIKLLRIDTVDSVELTEE